MVVDARDFYYSRISMAMGDDIALEIIDRDGYWQFVNDYFADLNDKKRAWFAGKTSSSSFRSWPTSGARSFAPSSRRVKLTSIGAASGHGTSTHQEQSLGMERAGTSDQTTR